MIKSLPLIILTLLFAFLLPVEIYEICFPPKDRNIYTEFLGDIVTGMIVSAIFYIIVVEIPKRIRKRSLLLFFKNKIENINDEILYLKRRIKGTYEYETREKICIDSLGDELILRGVLGKINTFQPVRERTNENYNEQYTNWKEYLKELSEMIKDDVISIFHFSDLLDSELIKILSEIESMSSKELHINYVYHNGNNDNFEFHTEKILKIIDLSAKAKVVFEKDFFKGDSHKV